MILPDNFKIPTTDRWMADVDTCIEKYPGECSGVFIDIGAHVGTVSVRARKSGFNTLYCYEPCLDNFTKLKQNILYPSPEDGDVEIHLLNMAVGLPGNCEFTVFGINDCNSGMRSGLYRNNQNRIKISTVPSISLCEVLQSHSAIQFLKVDTEGSEYDIFRPSPELEVSLSKVAYLDLEIHPPDDWDYFNPCKFERDRPWYSSVEAAPIELISYLRKLGFTDMTYEQVMKTKTLEFSSFNRNLK